MKRDRDIDSDPLDGRDGCSEGTKQETRIQYSQRSQQGVVSDVDYMLEAAGLPSYSLLQRSCEEATKFVLSITREPVSKQMEEYARKDIEVTRALTLLRPQPNETISQWATRYVATMLSDSEAITRTPRR